MPTLKDGEHLLRMAGLFAIGIGLFLVARASFVPSNFGQYGHFRPGALADNRARPVRFAGHASCEECHTDVVGARKGSRHEQIGCEACHGPQAAHANGTSEVAPTRPDTRNSCLICHQQNSAKPKNFPQIAPADHSDSGACTACHSAHNPRVA